PHHVAGGRDRGPHHRPHPARNPRPDAGAEMIRPTIRTVLIFVGGIPLALLVVIYEPSWWVLSFNYGALVLLAAGTDALLAFPPRELNVKVSAPDRLHIGERGTVAVTIAPASGRDQPGRGRRLGWGRWTTSFELIAEQQGEVEPPELAAAELAAGKDAHVAL